MKKIFLVLFLVASSFLGRAQDKYSLSDISKLTISGSSTVHEWVVTANTIASTLKYDGKSPKQIDVEVAVADIKSERGEAMDLKMYEALKKDKHPKITFKLTKVKGKSTFIGLLNIAGVEKIVEIPVTMKSASEGLEISGQKKLILQDYGMEPPTAMFSQIIVGDDVTVNFDLVFAKN